MRGLPFVPARDSRHRHAAFALCRALLRQAARIPLPKDLSPAAGQPNPVQALVLQQFRTNKGDTSPRLVLAALTGGYKFLSLFSKAQDPSSPSHAEVTTYIQERLAKNNGRITNDVRRRKPARPPIPTPPPILINTTGSNGLDTYERGIPPTPFEKLKDGKRHIPKLFVTSNHIPFLRMKKPQPYMLSKNIRSISKRVQEQIDRARELQIDDMQMAKHEDKWEKMMEKLADEACTSLDTQSSRRDMFFNGEAKFADATKAGARYLYDEIRKQRFNKIARAQALLGIIEEEKQLAREEAPRRRALLEEQRKLDAGDGVLAEEQIRSRP